jgi:hypothetical protein
VSRRPLSTLDLTLAEQACVRNALHLLKTKFETWKNLAYALRFEDTTVLNCALGNRTIMASMAFRVAKLAEVSVDELLSGRYPARGCPRCGYDRRDDGKIKGRP